MVDIDRLAAIVNELRVSVPADIQEATEILKQKDSIVNQAQLEARRIKDAASQEAHAVVAAGRHEREAKIDETEITKEAHAKSEGIRTQAEQQADEVVQEAQRRAYKILDEAESQAASRRDGSDRYAKETLFDLEERLSVQLGQIRRGIDALGIDRDIITPARAPSLNGAD